jgi:hypothetical protein
MSIHGMWEPISWRLCSNTYTNWIGLDLSWPWGVAGAVVSEKAIEAGRRGGLLV